MPPAIPISPDALRGLAPVLLPMDVSNQRRARTVSCLLIGCVGGTERVTC
jgi:hypothetical protein